MTLPNGITQDMVDDNIESRKLMEEPFTPLGLKRFIGRLGRAYADGLDVQDLIDKIQFPRFAHIRRYSREEFWDTYSWMVSNDLIQAGSEYEDAVIAGLTADT